MSFLSAKFELLKKPLVPAKRRQSDEAGTSSEPPAKLPRASSIIVSQRAPQDQNGISSKRLPPTAAVTICVYKVTDLAADLWDMFQGDTDTPLFQVQLAHDSQRSICYQLRESFNAFLAEAHEADAAMPASLKQLESTAGVRLVIADRNDPEGVGFKQWRPAFYCTDAVNFLHLFDSWLSYKNKQMAREEPLEVKVFPHSGVDLSDLASALTYVLCSVSHMHIDVCKIV